MGANLVTIVRNFAISVETFEKDSHDVQDGCVTPGQHRIMRFDFLSHNVGDADIVVGSPAARPDLFIFSAAHGHYHLIDFNEFKLFNSSGQQVKIGHKQAFCLIDIERMHPNARPDAQFTDCNTNQGISAGWADLYDASLACQYIVIDTVPDGDYTLQSTTNSKHVVQEDCYSDNTMWTGLRIQGDSVIEIPIPWAPEDRISLNPSNVEAVQIQSRWKVVEGNHWILDFGQKRRAAERAVTVIKHYGFSYLCFVGRPACSGQKPMTYWLNSQGQPPSGSTPNEDAIGFSPDDVIVRKIGQRWKIADGNNWLLDFGPAEGNAKLALYFIKKYGFTKICFVGRPNPPMVYFRT
jgi:Lysyl oxidase